jgi:hypothetical protein
MNRIRPEYLDPGTLGRSVADVLVREEPDEEEDEPDEKHKDDDADDDEEDDDSGYSE